MSNTTTIQQIQSMVDGQVIPAISGKLTRIYERKSGTHSHGEWSIQNGELEDDNGNSIKLQFKDRPEIPQEMKDRYVAIASNTTDKGTHGVKAFDDEYPAGTITRKLRITRSASFAEVEQPNQAAADLDYDPPFDEPISAQEPEYYPDIEEAPQQPAVPAGTVKSKSVQKCPDGVTVTSITYKEVRQKAQYEPITCELTMSIEPNTKLSNAWKYAEQAADAMLKHSTGK